MASEDVTFAMNGAVGVGDAQALDMHAVLQGASGAAGVMAHIEEVREVAVATPMYSLVIVLF